MAGASAAPAVRRSGGSFCCLAGRAGPFAVWRVLSWRVWRVLLLSGGSCRGGSGGSCRGGPFGPFGPFCCLLCDNKSGLRRRFPDSVSLFGHPSRHLTSDGESLTDEGAVCETVGRRLRSARRSARVAESDSLLMSCLGKPGPRVQIPASPPAKTMRERLERSGRVVVAHNKRS